MKSPLPIDDVIPQIIEHLKSSGALVLQAQPGAGKTTRVPPALLDAGLGKLAGGKDGQIVVLQPRRIAAKSAAMRIAEERGTRPGGEIGYQVRFEKCTSKDTRILICTEGIFLRRLQEDPFIEDVAAIVFDEFHERSIDSDLSLAMIRQVRNEIRPDLRIVVMSATLETASVAQYLGDCPVVESPGRTFPVAMRYRQTQINEPISEVASSEAKRLFAETDGHMLVFLPGVAEINDAMRALENLSVQANVSVLPLYGDLSLDEQTKVLKPSTSRKLILATNVAETSITVDGVTTVVDSGLARVNRLDPQLGLNRLELCRISKASAQQRAGRAGRTGPGTCLRLWSEREHHMLPDFERAEIARVDLSQCLLQLLAWGEPDVRNFSWFEPPSPDYTERALTLLQRLGAIDQNGKLTSLGREMATYPLQPRLARLLIEGAHNGCATDTAMCAALLSEKSPFRRTSEKGPAAHHSDSDVLDKLAALKDFQNTGKRYSYAGEILAGPAKNILRTAEQLQRLVPQSDGNKASRTTNKLTPAKVDEVVSRAIMSAFPDRICRRREANSKRAVMVGGRGVKLAEESAVAEAEFFVAVEVTDSGQSESLVRQASAIERHWLPKELQTSRVEITYDVTRQKVMAVRRSKYCDITLDETPVPIPPDIDPSELLATSLAAKGDLESIIPEEARQFMARVQCLREWMPELEIPDMTLTGWRELLPEWCTGCTSLAELTAEGLIAAIRTRLDANQIAAIEREAPERITVPSGSRIKIDYEPGKPPVVAVRVQELFGLRETPRLAASRVPVLLHLLAPNYRIQQITPDLASFWKNTYADVKKDLKRRYPKHSWPDDPLAAQPEHRPQRKKQQ